MGWLYFMRAIKLVCFLMFGTGQNALSDVINLERDLSARVLIRVMALHSAK
jgi:hypothetical protein